MPSSLTKADEKALITAGNGSMFWRAMPWIIFIIPVFFVLAAAADLSVASQLGEYERYSLRELVAIWLSPDPAEVYSGLQLQAVKRIEGAFGKLLLAILGAGAAIRVSADVRRRRRVYIVLRSQGLIGSGGSKT